MAIGSVLVRPQRFQRAISAQPSASLGDDLLNLGIRLLVDVSQGGSVLRLIGEGFEAAANRMVEQSSGGLTTAYERLSALVEPLIQDVQGLAAMVPDLDDPEKVVDAAQSVLTWLAELAGKTPDRGDRIRRFMEEGAVIDGVPVRVVEMTGEPGDAVLWHPALYHGRSHNCSSVPRFMRT